MLQPELQQHAPFCPARHKGLGVGLLTKLSWSDLPIRLCAILQAARDAGMGIEPNLTADLTALQRMLSGLEGAIALVRPGKDGFTAPGKFLWQLFGRAGITLEICPQLVMMMVTTAELLTTKGELMPAG